ncbi:cupin domain-containing protein [Epibacterium sp. DP7N7-1]|nr:cupin domain-containing protein [Epibacterium sp. DP7N7-1]
MSTLNDRIVRYGELRPCKTAFIDAHTPGSDQKENFTIIGGGVSESPDQHVHIRDTPGFNIGAAGQPPKCRNSLHSHTTAEVFFVLKGRWRFFWGRNGDAGEFIAEEGDIFNIPTGIFRGFENVGTDYGMIMAILGGDDAGGGVTWAPQVIEEARAHGLVLGNNGVLYDTKQGQKLPHNVQPMPTLTEEQMKNFPETPVEAVVPRYVARYRDLMALSGKQPAKVIGTDALLKDKPGFEVDFLSRTSLDDSMITPGKHVVLMPMRGHWALRVGDFDTVLNPGDTCLLKPGEAYSLAPSMTGEASLYRVTETDDPAGATWSGAA